jgi:hypothetical protein
MDEEKKNECEEQGIDNTSELNEKNEESTEQKVIKEKVPTNRLPIKILSIIGVSAIALVSVVVLAFSGIFAHTHEFGEWTETRSATCTVEGIRERLCSCGEKQSQSISKEGHSYTEWSMVENATCISTGLKKSQCTKCGDTLTESVAMVEHKYGDWQVTTSPTCENNGISESSCSVCNDIKAKTVAPTGHSYGSWSVTVNATCTADGKREKVCTKCNDKVFEVIKSSGHSLGSWVTVKSATCTEAGSKKQSCTKCEYSKTETVKATGHNMSSATCTKAKTCQKCGTTEGSALGHINVNGYCSRCGDKIEIDMKTVVGNPNDCKTTKYFGFCYYKNSADGIKVCWGGENLSGKTINYYTVTIYFYNSVGDPAYSEITGKSSKTIKYVGPIKPNGDLIIFGIVDYVPVCSKVVIGEITLEYSDGTSDTGWYGWSTTYRNSAIK